MSAELAVDILETDVGNGRRLIRHFGDRLRYVHPWKAWMVYDGKHWKRDKRAVVHEYAKRTVALILHDAAEAKELSRRRELVAHVRKSEGAARIEAMIRMAQSEESIVAMPSDFDANPFLLNVRNGTLDLASGDFRSHRREDLITRLAPVDYDPAAEAPRWQAFLHRVMDGNAEMMAFLQRASGYSLTGDTREDCFFLLVGSGWNGKSTYLEAVCSMLGGEEGDEYAIDAAIDTFLTKGPVTGASGDMARLNGARLVKASEPAKGRRWDEGRIKLLTGGEPVVAARKFEHEFQFLPQCKLWFSVNHKPQLMDGSRAMRRRLRLVPFRVEITDTDADFDLELDQKLAMESPGILNWALTGCAAWLEHGLGVPPEVREASDEYIGEADQVAAFLTECCHRAPKAMVPAGELYAKYEEWFAAEERDEEKFSSTAFGTQIRGSGLRRVRRGADKITCYVGVRLLKLEDKEKQGVIPFQAGPAVHSGTESDTDYITKGINLPCKKSIKEPCPSPSNRVLSGHEVAADSQVGR